MADTDFESFLQQSQAPAQPGAAPAAPAIAAPAPATAAKADPFESFLASQKQQTDAQTLQQAQAVAVTNSTASSDTAARAAKIAPQVNAPQAAIETDLPRYEAQAKAQDNAAVMAQSPQMAKWAVANPDAARVAQDDLGKMSTMETLLGAASDSGANFVKQLGNSFNSAAMGINRLVGYTITASDMAQGTNTAAWWNQHMIAPLEQAQPAFAEAPGLPFGAKAAGVLGNLTGMLSQITLTGGGGAVAGPAAEAASVAGRVGQAVGHGAKAMAFPALTAAVNTGHDVYAQTGDIGKAIEASQMQYATSTLGGIVPLGMAGNLAARVASGFISGAATGEVSRQAMNLVLPQKQEFDPEQMLLSGLSGAVLGGAMGPRAGDTGMHEAVRQVYQDAVQAETAEQGGQKMEQLGQLAGGMKLREADPAAFKQFVQQISENSSLQDVYVDGRTFADALQQSKVDVNEMPGMADQLEEAARTGGDVQIPVSDYLTHIAGTDLEPQLLPNLKAEAGGVTYAEGQQYYADTANGMQDKANEIVAQKQTSLDTQTDVNSIGDKLFEQMKATGRFPDDVSRASVVPVQEFYRTMADRMGVKPSELYEQYPLTIKGEDIGGQSLRQSEPPASLDDLTKQFSDAGLNASISEKNGIITLSKIIVPEGERGEGKGTAAMQALVDYADRTGQHVTLSPSADFGGNKKQLTDFYKRFGFVENKGKNRAFSTSESMYREAPGKVLHQASRGAFDPDTNTVALLKDADLSTFLHESSHFYLSTLGDLAGREGAPQELKDDMHTALTWMGGKDLTDWQGRTLEQQRDMHEKFAKGFETYLMEGKAPTTALQSLFSRFRSWMLNVYQSVRNLGTDLSPEVRGVFDRLLASRDAIQQSERARGYFPLDLSQSGATDKQMADYANLGDQATQSAINEMQARSLKDMQWASNAKNKALKALQRQHNDARREIQEQVMKELQAEPINRAREFLKTGETVDPQTGEKIKTEKGFKLNTDMAKELAPDANLRGLTSKDGMPPDMVADMFGFRNGAELVRNLAEGADMKELVARLTDQRMLEQHGELVDPQSVEMAANEAVHNEARAKFIATGLKLLTKSPVPSREITRAATEVANNSIAAKKVGDLNPRMYEVAEAKANKEAISQAAKDPAAAVKAQRDALLNNRLAKAATDAVAEIKKIVASQKKFDKDSIRNNFDPDILNQIDALRERFDFRQNPPEGPTKAETSLETWIQSQQALGYSPLVNADMLDQSLRMHYKDMTVEQIRGFNDTIRSLETVARERKQITIDGKHVALDAVVSDLVDKMQQRGDKFTLKDIVEPPRAGVDSLYQVGLSKAAAFIRGAAVELKPQQFKANQFDMHEILGPFSKSIFERVFDANYRKVDMLKGLSDQFRAAVKGELGNDWQDSLHDLVPNSTLLDADLTKSAGTPVYRRLTRGDMLGIARHVGNESNFDKLTKGMEWDPKDVWSFLHDNMIDKDWRATQITWDAFEKHWPDMVEMNKRLGNTSPDQIESRPFQTNFGDMRGGYAPIDYDPVRSRLAVKKSDSSAIDPSEGLFKGNYFRADTTTNGSLNSRTASYYDRLNLDYHSIERRLHDTVHDLAYREALLDTHKILANKDFRRQFQLSFGPEQYKSMQEWIGNIANSQNSDGQMSKLQSIMASSRRAIVANGIALRVSTVLKHGGSAGFKTAGYFSGGGEKYLAGRMAAMATNHAGEVASAVLKFPEIRARLMQQDRDYRQTASSLFEPESMHSKAERFGHSAVAWADQLTAVPTAWAAYDRAITEGIPVNRGGTGKPMSDEDAVKYASQIVREAHGSNIESSRSLLMQNKNEAVKAMTTLYGFMNNTLGQNMDMADKFKTAGFSKPEVLSRYLMAMIVPALWAGVLARPNKEEGWAHWAAGAITGEYAGMVPMVRNAWSAVEGYNSAGEPAYMSVLGTIAKPIMDIKKALTGGEVKAPIKDAGNAIGLIAPGGGQLGTTAQYLSDIFSGKEQPENAEDWARGVLLGQHKQR
ncbi:Phage protein [Collimonas arenae]|uniref:Phage protein n=2 Tax=Collimonas arenae TaxID=279058 RepID=A0A0A1F935_9BURK|nr:Phage protein [Collimonas arenae]